MEKNIYGYIRVSTLAQKDDRQWLAMENFGVHRECIYADKQSGKDFDRPAYNRLIARLEHGDTLVVKSLDRLGRNYDEMIEQLNGFEYEKLFEYDCALWQPEVDAKAAAAAAAQ